MEFVSNLPSYYKYDMTHCRRGFALIINNEVFKNLPQRDGSSIDAKEMKITLENLDFEVIVHNNQTVGDMKDLMRDMGSRDHSDNDCFLLAIFSHGDKEDILYGSDDKTVTLEEIMTPILPRNCKSLVDKPKLIFVSACRGANLDKGVDICDGGEHVDSVNHWRKVPSWADVLIGFGTMPGFYSWRTPSQGTWFIQALTSVFSNYGRWMELHSMLTLVNHKVANNFESLTSDSSWNRMKQIPCISSMLTKQVYFLPKDK
ncbi:caspase-3-like isoform X2 [Argonauta hians]